MQQITITSTSKGRKAKADVLHKSEKTIRVVVQGTEMALSMYRSKDGQTYVGNVNGLEFSTSSKGVWDE